MRTSSGMVDHSSYLLVSKAAVFEGCEKKPDQVKNTPKRKKKKKKKKEAYT